MVDQYEVNLREDGVENLKSKLLEIVIPEKIKKQLKDGAVRVAEKIRGYQPDLLVVLQRSGSLVCLTTEAYMEDADIVKPPKVEINIGTELNAIFWQESSHDEFNLVNTSGDDDPISEDIDGGQEYIVWLQGVLTRGEDERLNRVVATLKGAEEMFDPKKVLVYDDCRYQGVTLSLAVPTVMRHVFGSQVEFETVVHLSGDWIAEIIRASYGRVLGEVYGRYGQRAGDMLRKTFGDMLKGSYDSEIGLVPITSDNLESFLERRREGDFDTRSFLLEEKRLEKEELIGLSGRFRERMRDLGRRID